VEIKTFYNKMSDVELLGLIGYLEDWPVNTVYETAQRQVYPESQLKTLLTFDAWIFKQPPLPEIVRQELVRACELHDSMGNMTSLKIQAFCSRYGWRIAFWSFLILWWVW